MFLTQSTKTSLGWPEVREALAREATTPQGRSLCLSVEPTSDPEEIVRRQNRVECLDRMLSQGLVPPIEPIEELEQDLTRATKQGALSAEAIRRIGQAMLISSRVRRFLMNESDQSGVALIDLARNSHDLSGNGRDLLAAFDDTGALRDSASPELGRLRKTARNLADAIRTRLERMLRTKKVLACLQEPYITQRADRYVLPVRADAPDPFPGIVHDTSQSGATLFVEPASLVDDGNRLKIASAAVVEEEKRILAEYTSEIGELSEDIRENLYTLARFDLVLASQRLMHRLEGRMIPVDGSGIHLLQARHPLMQLAGDPVVPNDIRLLSGQLCLIVTGPNAGGKTVALKTVGMIALLAQAGLPVPAAEGSRLGLFSSLHAVIGDAQDIQRGLSTFSAHIADISRILEQSGPGTLVLLDELAADTDPRHGAALASSLLERLVERRATTVVTTHFEELKQLAYQNDGFANASVGFDMDRMEPTYQLHPDVPGRSLTLDIARRLGIPEEVLQAAASRLGGSERELERMLRSLEEERLALEDTRRDLLAQQSRTTQTMEEHRHAKEELAAQKKHILLTQSADELAEIRQLRIEVAAVIESLRRNKSLQSASQAGEKLKEIENQLRQVQRNASAGEESFAGEPGEFDKLRPGDRILITSLQKEGQITGFDRRARMVSVRLGSTMRTRVPIEQVRLLAPAPPRRPAPQRKETVIGSDRGEEIRTPANTLDLRGQRVDEAIEVVEKFLDRLFGDGEPNAFLIHGHGTGALKTAVREYLRNSPYPRHFRPGAPEEGGDGVTVVKLK